uniref:RRM domain-containing protein n=1 Tax=Scylla olivacea TaxID=85551 RepID=A0A0P4WB21_SCYOL
MKPSGPSGPSGWEEPSPQSQRRDDGTAVWGNPQQQSSVSRWKDMPTPNMMGRPGMPGPQQGRMPGPPVHAGIRPDQRWGQNEGCLRRNGSWSDSPHDTTSGMWVEEPKSGGWGEQPITPPSWSTKPKTPTGGPGGPIGWAEPEMDLQQGWSHHNKVPKGVSKDLIYNSKQFRTLLEMGYKKEDIEAALRNNNMALDDSLMELGNRGGGGGEAWRNTGLEEHAPFDINNPNFQRFPPGPHHLPFPSQGGSGNAPHVRALMQHIQTAVQAGYLNPQILNQPLAPTTLVLLNHMLSHINVLQKFSQQQALCQAHAHLNKNSSTTLLQLNINITKTKQQIQNLQNQIAAQQALYVKQQQQHHQQLHPHISAGPPGAQADFFTKPSLPDQLYGSFNQLSVSDNPAAAAVVSTGTGSRLHQHWKLPSPETDDAEFIRAPGAPGKPTMPQSHPSPNLTPLLGSSSSTWSLNRTSESGWPENNTVASDNSPSGVVDKGVPNMDTSQWAASSQANVSGSYGLDIKPFEPGKPWLMKNIEDDPNITPGSVTRSPLSINIKDSELLSSISKTPTTNTVSDITSHLPSLSLSSNTWSFNPGPGHHTANSPLSVDSKLGGSSSKSGSGWSEGGHDGSTTLASELWGAPGNKLRGPPPGLIAGSVPKSGVVGGGGGSGSGGGGWGALSRSTSWSGDQHRNPQNSALHSAAGVAPSGAWTNNQPPSTWLILKNLTPQIDGSTLKTLCMQHGPLVNFYLSLNHGFALVNYGSREEAAKAQGNLNNCLLSNTTILAEFASDSDVKQVMGQPTHQGQAAPPTPAPTNSSSWGASGRGSTPTSQPSSGSKVDSWGNSGSASNLWGNSGVVGSSLWGGSSISEGGEQHRTTPSSLKPYLPDGLLTSESI